jgi:hypothetical protein
MKSSIEKAIVKTLPTEKGVGLNGHPSEVQSGESMHGRCVQLSSDSFTSMYKQDFDHRQ